MAQHTSVNNLMLIKETLKKNLIIKNIPKIIAVSKTFNEETIIPVINFGHNHFGENKVQEAYQKWPSLKEKSENIILHMIGKLQTNKVKIAVSLFDYIHSLDNFKLADKIADEQTKQKKSLKIFIQVNIGQEDQKSGIRINDLPNFYEHCKKQDLEIVGLMCIPPANKETTKFFKELYLLSLDLKLRELSMGMSSDYINAAKNGSTFLRIGSGIFGKRNN